MCQKKRQKNEISLKTFYIKRQNIKKIKKIFFLSFDEIKINHFDGNTFRGQTKNVYRKLCA